MDADNNCWSRGQLVGFSVEGDPVEVGDGHVENCVSGALNDLLVVAAPASTFDRESG